MLIIVTMMLLIMMIAIYMHCIYTFHSAHIYSFFAFYTVCCTYQIAYEFMALQQGTQKQGDTETQRYRDTETQVRKKCESNHCDITKFTFQKQFHMILSRIIWNPLFRVFLQGCN